MENNKYQIGQKICSELFAKTGDIRYHNMMQGFMDLEKENELKKEEEMQMQ